MAHWPTMINCRVANIIVTFVAVSRLEKNSLSAHDENLLPILFFALYLTSFLSKIYVHFSRLIGKTYKVVSKTREPGRLCEERKGGEGPRVPGRCLTQGLHSPPLPHPNSSPCRTCTHYLCFRTGLPVLHTHMRHHPRVIQPPTVAPV